MLLREQRNKAQLLMNICSLKERTDPPRDCDKPKRDGEDDPDKEKEPPKDPPDPPDPPEPPGDRDPDDPEGNEEEEGEEEEEEEEGEGEEEEEEETEEEEEMQPDEVVESASTKKKRKEADWREKVKEAAMIQLPYGLPDEGPSYKGVISLPKEDFKQSGHWSSTKGPMPRADDESPIDLRENRAFENIRLHQISSIFSLQEHLVDCEKGSMERNSTPSPLRASTGEYSPCKTEMKTVQSDDGTWVYEHSELPGLIRMRHGMKSFDIIEQSPFSQTPKGPHRNLVRQIIDQTGIEVKSKQVRGKETRYIESIRAARVLLYDISNHQYTGKVERGLQYHPSILHLSGGVPVSKVDATGDWAHLASLVEMIKGIRQRWVNYMPFYLRGLVRMVPMNQLHHILLYAALTDLKTNIQIGIDASAYIWVRALQYHDDLHQHLDDGRTPIAFHKDGQFYKTCPFITALFRYAEVVEAFATQDDSVQE